MSTTTAPPGIAGHDPAPAARRFTLALSEVAECQRDLASAALMPPTEATVSKLAGVAAGLDRAAGRIRAELLNQQPAAPTPAEPPAVTPEMLQAADDALEAQYRAQPWETSKDVMEGIDMAAIITAALAAQKGDAA